MNQDAHFRVTARAGKAGSAILIVVGVLFFAFGTVLTGVADTAGEPELALLVWMFRLIWWVVCGGMIVFGILGLTRKGGPAIVEADVDPFFPEDAAAPMSREQATNANNLPSD